MGSDWFLVAPLIITTEIMKRNQKFMRRALFAFIAVCASSLVCTGYANAAEVINDALRIYVDGKRILGEADLQARKFADSAAAMAAFKKNIVSIRRNATVRLTVETINAQGQATAVTNNPATSYHSLSPSSLSVSSDGVVTAAPSIGSQSGGSGDIAVLVVFERGTEQAWNKVFFNLIP